MLGYWPCLLALNAGRRSVRQRCHPVTGPHGRFSDRVFGRAEDLANVRPRDGAAVKTAGETGLPGHLSPLQLVFVGHAAIEAAAPDSGVVIYTNLVSIEFRTRPVTDRARPTS